MTLKETLECKITRYNNSDFGWVQYVRDNLWYIRGTAQRIDLDVYRHNTMKYRLGEFIVETFNMPRDVAWIVLYINQLESDVDFRDLESILIPDMKVIDNLCNMYRNLKAQESSIS